MRIKNAITAAALAAALATQGCSGWIDVNTNPGSPEKVPPEMMLPGIEVAAGYTMMSWDFLFCSGIYCQYLAQAGGSAQFQPVEQFGREEFSAVYRNMYTQVLSSAREIEEKSSENSGISVAAELLSIYAWQVIVDTWGDVPYSEALDRENFAPKFDSAQDIYDGLIARVDSAIARLEEHLASDSQKLLDPIPAACDLLYGGSIEGWLAFANSLKLRIMTRLSNTGKFSRQEVYDFIMASDFISENCQISENAWEPKSGKMYPMDEYDNSNFCRSNINASMSITAYMHADPRLDVMFTGRDGKIQGNYGGPGIYEQKSKINTEMLKRNIPLISAWEIYFDIAEACLWAGDEETARYCYETAVQMSFAYWGCDGLEGAVIAPSGYQPWIDGQDEANFKSICLQRWASFAMCQHAEAFNEINRTGYPELSQIEGLDQLSESFPAGCLVKPVCGTVTGNKRPKSMAYPQSDVLDCNSSAPSQKPDITQRIFWQMQL